MAVREATQADFGEWDARTVAAPGGDVFQSLAWGAYRSRIGWRPHYLIVDEALPVLALERRWRGMAGGGAYISRGPVWSGDSVETAADRLSAVADWLGDRGVDVVSSDAEIPAASGYAALTAARGFRTIEEIQPSRHRLRRVVHPERDEAAIFASLPATVRQRIRQAKRRESLRVVRYDTLPGDPRGFDDPPGGAADPGEATGALDRLYDLLVATAARRHFFMGPRTGFLDWGGQALAAGMGFILEARSPDGTVIAASLFYRHGQRITYANAADLVGQRRAFPGAVHLVLWRALQMTCREGRLELDLGGVDVRGARHKPVEGEEMYGLLRFKELLGGEWLALCGNQERIIRPWRYRAGRASGRLAALLDRRP